MKLENEFALDVPIGKAWTALTDVELIAPCMPGAVLTGIDGDSFTGVVKLKIGPILTQFKGQASFTELDSNAYRAVLKARAKDTTGKGSADALITMQLLGSDGGSTRCTVTTDLAISGKVAQFGRGAMTEIGSRMIEQFAARLQETVLASPKDSHEVEAKTQAGSETAGSSHTASPAPRLTPVTPTNTTVADVAPLDLNSIIPLQAKWAVTLVGLTVLTIGLTWLLT
ncbi:SRPBCC family protein [Rhodococcus jostii]|uniref:SRPBCC family protein n=1 Tax=Rhodococcus jostii TaxID=132919 RepID=UPI0013C2D06F|nr:SRPBCC family protein [Rhodococcus jostii]